MVPKKEKYDVNSSGIKYLSASTLKFAMRNGRFEQLKFNARQKALH